LIPYERPGTSEVAAYLRLLFMLDEDLVKFVMPDEGLVLFDDFFCEESC